VRGEEDARTDARAIFVSSIERTNERKGNVEREGRGEDVIIDRDAGGLVVS